MFLFVYHLLLVFVCLLSRVSNVVCAVCFVFGGVLFGLLVITVVFVCLCLSVCVQLFVLIVFVVVGL